MDKETKIRKNNMKLFPYYKMFSYDLLFFYSISFLFLVDIKGLTPAQAILTDAYYPIFKFILQPFCTIITQKCGKRNSLIFANCLISLYLILILFATGFTSVVIATFFCSFGYIIKNMCETDFLYESVPHSKNRGEIFGKLDGKGFTYFYFFDGITSLLTGFTYVINPYLPIIISLTINTIAIILSTHLYEIPKNNTEKLKNKQFKAISTSFKDFVRDFKYGFRYVLKSNRLHCLIAIYSIIYGMLALTLTLRRSLLKELNVSAEYFGIIFAIMGIIAAISALSQNWLNKTFKNRTLTVLSLPYCISCFLIGLLVIFNIDMKIVFPLLMILYAVQYMVRGPFNTIIKRYLNNFSTTKARHKIYSITTFFESFIASLITVVGSVLVDCFNSAYAFLIIGIVSTSGVYMLLQYMKTRVGLKPEEYPKQEIEMLNLK